MSYIPNKWNAKKPLLKSNKIDEARFFSVITKVTDNKLEPKLVRSNMHRTLSGLRK
jgi:hypothetical protein